MFLFSNVLCLVFFKFKLVASVRPQSQKCHGPLALLQKGMKEVSAVLRACLGQKIKISIAV